MASPAAADGANGVSTPPPGTRPSPSSATQNRIATPEMSQQNSTQATTNGSSRAQNQSNPQAQMAQAEQLQPAQPPTSLQDSGLSKRPRDARLLHLLLTHMGVQSYPERVPLQLMDFAYRYTAGVLSDAVAVSAELGLSSGNAGRGKGGGQQEGASEGSVSLPALRQAVASRLGYQFSSSLPKEFLLDIAAERNRVAIPRADREFGVRLPPEKYCLTGVGWGLKDEWDDLIGDDEEGEGEGQDRMEVEMPEVEREGQMEDDNAREGFEDVMGADEDGDREMGDG